MSEPRQGWLFDEPRGAETWLKQALELALPNARLVMTDNRVRLASVSRHGDRPVIRVSRRLLEGEPQCVPALVDFACGRPRGRGDLQLFIARLPPPERTRPVIVRPLGEVHNLVALLEAESLRAFGESAQVPVTWGTRRRVGRRQRTLRLGSYTGEPPLIRIHPLLDHGDVPAWFVGTVLHHELLHHRLGVQRQGGRRRVHTREFRVLERQHPRHLDAARWQQQNLGPLLRRGRQIWGGA